MKIDYYQNYTSTVMLTRRDEAQLTADSIQSFRYAILPHLPGSKTSTILDVGCGYGRYLKALTEFGYCNAYGIDISEEQIRYAQERLGLKSCKVADGLGFLKDKNETYDVILLLDVLEHLSLDDSICLIRSVNRALKNAGVLVVQVPNAISPLAVHRYGDLTHFRAYTTHSMEQTLLLGGQWKISHFGPLLSPPIGVKGIVRAIIWHGFLRPLIHLYVIAAYSRYNQGIYTPNLLTIAKKTNVN